MRRARAAASTSPRSAAVSAAAAATRGAPMQGAALTRASSSISAVGAGRSAAEQRRRASRAPTKRSRSCSTATRRRSTGSTTGSCATIRRCRGQMVLRLTIEPDGSVSMCELQSTDMNAPELSAQVVDRVRTINFGAKEVPADHDRVSDRLPAGGVRQARPRSDEFELTDRQSRRDSDKGKATERWRRKVTGLTGARAPRQRDRRNPVRQRRAASVPSGDEIAR